MLSRVRHPSFTPEVADELVRDLTVGSCSASGGDHASARRADQRRLRFSLVVLREHVLSELERHDPGALSVCARRDRSVQVRERRAGRS